MLLNAPEHLNEEQKKQYQRAWIRILNLTLTAVAVVGISGLGLVGHYLWGDRLAAMFDRPDPVPLEEQARRLKAKAEDDYDRIENGIHVMTGLKVDKGWQIVRGTCTACHSAKLVTQNRATREGWKKMIVWMQETQNLWDLGEQEDLILDYLAANYAPEEAGRRPNLDLAEVEWYILELDEVQ